MRFFMYLLCIMFVKEHCIIGTEYLYPVACYNDGRSIIVMRQKNYHVMTILLWDKVTNKIEEGLWSLFNPTNVHILPDETGFSFIDNGRIRVKYFNKRSPKTIECDHNFYKINSFNWINSQEYYCSAKTSHYYSLFHCTVDGDSYCIASESNAHCLYPQKIDTDLFFIKETYDDSQQSKYHIVHTHYPENIIDHEICSNNETIIDCHHRPLICLRMISKEEGFVIEHAREINKKDIINTFKYHHLLKQDNNIWALNHLFDFSIPISLFLPEYETCLNESILPLIPNIIDSKIYFVDSSNNNNNELQSYYYDLNSKEIVKNPVIKNNFFVPITCKNQLLAGGPIKNMDEIIYFSILT